MTATETETAEVVELPTTYTISQVLALTGVKYRFVDYAIRAGYLGNDTAHGSGSQRRFTSDEIDTVHAAQGLIGAGFTAKAAFRIAAEIVAHDGYSAAFGDIWQLNVQLAPPTTDPTEEPA